MKIVAYEVRPDEVEEFARLKEKYNLELVCHTDPFTAERLAEIDGADGVTTIGFTRWNAELLEQAYAHGLRFLTTRSIGYDHVDLAAAKRLGIRVCNAAYPSNAVADFTVMLMLIALRNYKPALWRQQVNDYSLGGLQGRNLNTLTVGVVGTGRIGKQVIRNLSGFGSRILAFDGYRDEEVKGLATYVSLEELYRESDIISVHVPLTDETKHMINTESIAKMKDGVILVNTARGGLMDIQSLIAGVENRKIGALALDVFEDEIGIYHKNRKSDILKNREMAYIRQFPNVILTQHMAFYTKQSVDSMVDCGVECLLSLMEKGSSPLEVTK